MFFRSKTGKPNKTLRIITPCMLALNTFMKLGLRLITSPCLHHPIIRLFMTALRALRLRNRVMGFIITCNIRVRLLLFNLFLQLHATRLLILVATLTCKERLSFLRPRKHNTPALRAELHRKQEKQGLV